MAPALYSLEFFPPKTPEGISKLRAVRRELAELGPAFCSVTFGAGGSTREGTLATVLEIRAEGMEGATVLPPVLPLRRIWSCLNRSASPSGDRA